MSEELKPCPWCGNALLGDVAVAEGSTFRWRRVVGCCAEGPEVRHDTLADDQVAAERESRQKAIDAWNTRPHHSQAPTAGGMVDHWPAPITNPEAWPPNFADGWNAAVEAAHCHPHAAQAPDEWRLDKAAQDATYENDDLKCRCDAYESNLTAMPFEFDNGPGGDDQWCVCTTNGNLTGCDMDKDDAILFADLVNFFRSHP